MKQNLADIYLSKSNKSIRNWGWSNMEFICVGVCLLVFSATFNNMLAISWLLVLLVEETGENHRPDKLYHILLYRVHLTWAGFELTTLVVIDTDCIYR